ncbi:MAG: heparin lyase I family protein [Rubrobacter sp.]|nr:heparin lyase I family protein [Rubrobacter sp.]
MTKLLILTGVFIVLLSAPAEAQAKAQCNDKRDNDSDGKIDLSDPGCTSRSDNDETNPIVVTPPPPAGSGVLWMADGEDVTENEWAELSTHTNCAVTTKPGITDSRINRVLSPAYKGAYAYKASVQDGDNCYGERAELGQGNPTRSDMLDRLFREGEERWISFDMRLGSDYKTYPGTWQSVMQLKQMGALGSPVMGMHVEEGQWQLRRTSSDPNNQWPYGFQGKFNLGTAKLNTWTKWTWHVKFSPNSSVGFLEIFADTGDGQGIRQVFGKQFMSTMKVDNGTTVDSHARVGPYRDPAISGTATVYYDGWTVATDRATAERNAF